MSPTPPSGKPARVRYHYVITVQFEQRNGVQQLSYEADVFEPAPGQTRGDVFRQIFRNATRDRGINPVPLFFSLEPDDLTVTSPKEG